MTRAWSDAPFYRIAAPAPSTPVPPFPERTIAPPIKE